MSIKPQAIMLLAGWLLAAPAMALTATNDGSGSNTYMFIDNDVDDEYFITTSSLSPRFTGANIWTKYKTNQRSLGYMGNSGWSYSNRYFDLWIDNSPINQPFLGLRCMSTGANCPASGYIPADVLDKDGFYHAMSGNSVANGYYGAGVLSQSAYEYFRNRPVGTIDNLQLNLCYMDSKADYDFASGVRCKDLPSGGKWVYYTMNLEKVSHLTLNSTGAMAEVWIASDGTPSVNLGSELCQMGVVGSASGIICKMVSYSFQETKTLTTSLDFRMVIDTTLLGFSPSSSDVKYSGDGASWTNFGSTSTYNKVFKPSGEYIYVFLSNAFFKKALKAGTDLTNKDELFTFYFDNSVTPQSGYYQFTPSTLINIIPREYGISIIASDGSAHPKASGKIGSETPITFEYKVTTSASRQADSITAQVTGDAINIYGQPYCLFTSADETLKVPVPAFLEWTSAAGNAVRVRNSCGENPVDMTNAAWVQTAWNANVNDGFFFTTTLKLLFPMDDSHSQFTTDGHDWMGTVSATGDVKVTATWVGVDRGGMMKKMLFIGLCGLCIQPASAVYFDSIIYDMDASKDFISRPLVNDTSSNNLYTISAYKIARPGNGNERPVPGQDKDLVWSPLQFTVQANGQEYFKLYYRGPGDDIERYYRVIFKETPVTVFPWRMEQKKLNIVPSVSMSTILIVRPRKTRFQYEINEATGTIKNTGNTYFRVILQKGCNGDDESSTQFYMLPGDSWTGPEAKNSNRKYIVALGRYHKLGDGCFMDAPG
ncbi:Fimbria adhesin EcpD [Klebsiella pneumoniae]|nr:CFA/I fimbrial minor adhesin [Klebsiella pneumoniae IS43]SYM18112.1 CFA/I fimbrial minor adhesin [Klebsiella pneumoniae]SYN05279.1 CFA/I fimbrial minor adhesin [Klebsiella pneumoniae]SYN26543.1 CFA/I fimbrial minor adhesin [Klebsiella pneumoniae]SYN40622.1 CFA/I fimbrial minor adhesin [Klebsiella pneumoniae]